MKTVPIFSELLRKMDIYPRTSNYRSIGRINLFAGPPLMHPLQRSHVKPLLVGHWSTTSVRHESLVQRVRFRLWHPFGQLPFTVGAADVRRVPVSIEGVGQVKHRGATYTVGTGDLRLLPAVGGTYASWRRSAVTRVKRCRERQFHSGNGGIAGRTGSADRDRKHREMEA